MEPSSIYSLVLDLFLPFHLFLLPRRPLVDDFPSRSPHASSCILAIVWRGGQQQGAFKTSDPSFQGSQRRTAWIGHRISETRASKQNQHARKTRSEQPKVGSFLGGGLSPLILRSSCTFRLPVGLLTGIPCSKIEATTRAITRQTQGRRQSLRNKITIARFLFDCILSLHTSGMRMSVVFVCKRAAKRAFHRCTSPGLATIA